jgi:hypothetical protein
MVDVFSIRLRESSIGLRTGHYDLDPLFGLAASGIASYVEITVYVNINGSPTKNQPVTNVFPTFPLGSPALLI